jgi:glycosyltransferase involved in cell wall biosynthesis
VDVSVVMPVRNGEATITRAVSGVLAQDYPPDRYEVIVVDNASTDRTPQLLAALGPRVRVLREATRGASAARNAGVLASRHSHIAFIDADCIPDASWLTELVRASIGPGAGDFVGGRIVAHEPSSSVELFVETIMDQERAIRGYRPPGAVTANLMARRDLLCALGLFDPSLRRGQDVDLSYRAYFERGATFTYAERAVVRHVNPRTLPALFRKGVQHGFAVADVLRKHSARLSQTPLRQCLAWRRYAAILREGGHLVRCAGRRYLRGDTQAAADSARSICALVFESGKQCGTLLGTIRGVGARRRRTRPERS